MLELRKAQIDRLDEEIVNRFTDEVIAHVRIVFAVRALDAGDTRRNVELGIRKARSYGFCLSNEVVHFVYLMFIAGLQFDQEAAIASVLANRRASTRARLQRVFHLVSARRYSE